MQALIRFIEHEATAGLILVLAAIAALVFSNVGGLSDLYAAFLDADATVAIGSFKIEKPLSLWINDGLMAVFFLLVGLEIKREVLDGDLSSRAQIVLPALAAAGGVAVPAAIYLSVVWGAGDQELLNGWAIPAATDIAFALGALALVGEHVPPTLKVFLLTLATLDDLGAILIIALFYGHDLSIAALLLAASCLVLLFLMNRTGVTRIAPYMFVGIAMWVFVLKSGVHATLAGVALGLSIPLKSRDGHKIIEHLEESLHPYVKWAILPLFAFANAGVSLEGMTARTILEPLPLAIIAGLFIGKPVGIFGMCVLTVKSGLAKLPGNASWPHMLGVSMLAGIGFTMSLFIGMLAFEGDEHSAGVRLGVLVGSVLSAVAGYLVLRLNRRAGLAVARRPAAG